MPTITTVKPTWETGVEVPADALRRADSTAFLGDGSNNGVRGGIVRHGDNSLAVSVNGSDQVTVQSGAAVIPAATGLGVYRAALSAATTATGLSSRNATNPRVDLVVMQIESGAAVVKTVDGDPSSSPVAKALPANAVELARLNVPALGGGAVTVTTSFRQYAAALGGTLHVETAARLPGSGNQKGQRAVALDTGTVYSFDNGLWVAQGVSTPYTPILAGGGTQGNAVMSGSSSLIGKTRHFRARMVAGSTTAISSGPLAITLPSNPKDAGSYYALSAELTDVGSQKYAMAVDLTAPGTVQVWEMRTSGVVTYGATGTTNPFTWAAGDSLDVRGIYEEA